MVLNGADGGYEITEMTREALRKTYPLVDVDTELAKMHLWLLKNPASRPKRVMRFVETWLKRSKKVVAPKIVSSWWVSEGGTQEMAARMGVPSKAGESWEQWRNRIRDAIRVAA